MSKLDIETYRTKREALDFQSIQADIIEALSNPQNIALWKHGVTSPSSSHFSDAYSHFQGFRNITIDRASILAQKGGDRFLANKVEHILDPQSVQTLLKSFTNLDKPKIEEKIKEFIAASLKIEKNSLTP